MLPFTRLLKNGGYHLEDFLVRERVRATTYNLLAQCYMLPEKIKEDKFVDSLFELLSLVNEEAAGYTKLMKDDLQKIRIDELKFDYLSMFVGPKTLLAPPYGSIYMEEQGQIMGASTYDAMRMYQEAGLKKAVNFKEPPDHIRVELDFMFTLIQQTIELCEESKLSEAENKINLQLEFLAKHIAGWVKPFTNNIIENAKTDFYKNLAKATEAFIRQEFIEDSIAMQEEFKELSIVN